jgi:hypothetical protein
MSDLNRADALPMNRAIDLTRTVGVSVAIAMSTNSSRL